MSSLNPLAGAPTGGGSADPIAAELAALRADAEALRTLLASGDIVAAKVLPFNGLTDLIEILGKRVAASLPPTVRPGDTLILEVAGFDGDRIVVRNLGVDANAQRAVARNANPPVYPEAGEPAAAPGPGTALPNRTAAPPAQVELPATPSPAAHAEPAEPSAAAPRAPAGNPPPAGPSAPAGLPAGYPRVTIAVPSRAIGTEQSLEARLIAARAPLKAPPAAAPAATPAPAAKGGAFAPPAGTARPAAPGAVPQHPGARPAQAPASPPAAGNAAAAPARTPAAPRAPAWIETAARAAAGAETEPPPAAAGARAPRSAAPEPAAPPPAGPSAAPQAPAAGRTAQTYREPVVLLRSLHLPVTPSNVAAAKLALETPQRLPVALTALERSLPPGSADPRVNTLRTLAAFVTNLDPHSESFPQQLSAYVSHVVDGPEPKLAQILRLFAQAAPPEAEAAPQSPPAAPPAPPAGSPAPHTAAAPPSAAAPAPGAVTPDVATIARQDPAAAAKIVERSAALDFDLKTQLQAFIAQPPPNASPATLAAAQSALTALTAAQLNNAASQQDPRAVTFSIPLPFSGNGEPARVKISREKPNSKDPLDADNFHIAFVLDTKNVGTVAIDLQTVGRAVNLSVKSETPRYAAAFKSHLEQIGGRLETLRYRVVALESDVVARAGATVSTAAPPPVRDDEPRSGVDLQA